MTRAREATQILKAVQAGDLKAAEELFPLLYSELHRMASREMAHEVGGHTLQPTALVHEAWLRLVGENEQEWPNRSYFFSAAAEAMRRILVEHGRRRQSLKRGKDFEREGLERAESELVIAAPTEELLAVNDALEKLALEDAALADLVKLRYFVGMTMEEAATALNLTARTAERLWAYARVWLQREIEKGRE